MLRGLNLGIAAGKLGEIFIEDNKAVQQRTNSVLDNLAELVINKTEQRTKKVRGAEEYIERLESLGFTKPRAASIARGGAYAVQDAAGLAEQARTLGQDINSWYTTNAKYEPEQYANLTTAELAEGIVPDVNIGPAAELYKGRERIDTDAIDSMMAKMGESPRDTARLPTFSLDKEKSMTTDIKTLYSNKLSQKFRLQENLVDPDIGDTEKIKLNSQIESLDNEIDRIYDFGTKNKIFAGTGMTGPTTRTNFNVFMQGELDRQSRGGKFGGAGAASFTLGDGGFPISSYSDEFQPAVDAARGIIAATYVGNLMKNNQFQNEAEATMSALGYNITTITEDMVTGNDRTKDITPEDVGQQAVVYQRKLYPIEPEMGA